VTALHPAFLPDLLGLHFEELQFLWARRRAALRSPTETPRELVALEERIEAHVQGLLVVGTRMLPLVEPALTGEDRNAAFAAAYALLRLGDPALAERVVAAIPTAPPPARRGLAEALCHVHAPAAEAGLRALAVSGDPAIAAVAFEVLAFRGGLRPDAAGAVLDSLLAQEDPATRAAGWRVATYLCAPVQPRYLDAALRDETPGIRRAALEASAWAGAPVVLDIGRRCADRAAEQPAPELVDALRLLAVLGGPEDVRRVAALAYAPALGPARFAIAGSLGSPALVDALLAGMADPDPVTAAAAGAAFTKLTGHDVTSPDTATVGSGDDDAAGDTVALPDPGRARAVWGQVGAELSRAHRLCRGFDAGRGIDADAAARLDLESRWELFLRARYYNAWSGLPAQLEVFPQYR
jgi:uncharacterized protein (TIGR02270 family)